MMADAGSEEKTNLEDSDSEVGACDRKEDKSPYGVTPPPQKIQVISEDDIGGRDLLIVGDVHGCVDELKELIETNFINSENTCVIFVGDLVNKGPKSPEVVEYVKKNSWYSVRGNHDEISMKEWTQSKDGKEPPAKLKWVENLPKESLDWLHERPYIIHIPSRMIVIVHAGLLPENPLENQDPDTLMHIRCVKQNGSGHWEWTRKYLEEEEEDYKLWGKMWSGPEHVYFGHDARRLYQKHKHATGLDTACVYGIELTAVYPLTGRTIKVSAHQNYTSSEKFVSTSE